MTKKRWLMFKFFFLLQRIVILQKEIVMEQDKTKNILDRKQIFLRKKFFKERVQMTTLILSSKLVWAMHQSRGLCLTNFYIKAF